MTGEEKTLEGAASGPRLLRFVRENRAPVAALLLALLVAAWFAMRTLMALLSLDESPRSDIELEPWMTPRYVSLAYDLPPAVVREALELEAGERGRTLGRLARERGVDLEDLTALVRDAAVRYDGDNDSGDGTDGTSAQ